jgi:hypothetical protein
MTKLGQDVVHFSHHSPSPFFVSFYERCSSCRCTPLPLLQFGGPALDEGEHFFDMSLSVAMGALPRSVSLLAVAIGIRDRARGWRH